MLLSTCCRMLLISGGFHGFLNQGRLTLTLPSFAKAMFSSVGLISLPSCGANGNTNGSLRLPNSFSLLRRQKPKHGQGALTSL